MFLLFFRGGGKGVFFEVFFLSRVGGRKLKKKKKLLKKKKQEEDRLAGYLSLLKVGPALLKFLPGRAAADVRRWLTTYSYWNAGGRQNVASMLLYLSDEVLDVAAAAERGGGAAEEEGALSPPPPPPPPPSNPLEALSAFAAKLLRGEAFGPASDSSPSAPAPIAIAEPAPVVETPATGCIHPGRPGHVFASPAEYLRWYASSGRAARAPAGAPVVAVLLYRKHVVTDQPYLPELIDELERGGLVPVPIFINGVEAHTVVRDLLTTDAEIERGRGGGAATGSGSSFSSSASSSTPDLASELSSYSSPSIRIRVDAVVSTIGFPLVGGPAGTMEGGRQAEVAKEILQSKDVPYFVAAPLLIQDVRTWAKDGEVLFFFYCSFERRGRAGKEEEQEEERGRRERTRGDKKADISSLPSKFSTQKKKLKNFLKASRASKASSSTPSPSSTAPSTPSPWAASSTATSSSCESASRASRRASSRG